MTTLNVRKGTQGFIEVQRAAPSSATVLGLSAVGDALDYGEYEPDAFITEPDAMLSHDEFLALPCGDTGGTVADLEAKMRANWEGKTALWAEHEDDIEAGETDWDELCADHGLTSHRNFEMHDDFDSCIVSKISDIENMGLETPLVVVGGKLVDGHHRAIALLWMERETFPVVTDSAKIQSMPD